MDTLQKILYTMKKNGLSNLEFQYRAGLPTSAVFDWKSGKTKSYNRHIPKIAEVLGVEPDWLMSDSDQRKNPHEDEDENENMVRLPIYGTIKAGYNGIAYRDYECDEWVDASSVRGNIESYFWLRVRGDSMAPRIEEGDLVLIRSQQDCENGEVAAVMIDGDESTLKKVKKGRSFIQLVPFNPSYETLTFEDGDMERIRIIGIAREIKAKL